MTQIPPTIDHLLAQRDLKRAEVLIARWLRADPPDHERASALLARARVRLLNARIDDALHDIGEAAALDPALSDLPQAIEVRGDAHFARFELAAVGFADRGDAEQALVLYDQLLRLHPQYDNIGWVYYQKARVLLTENRVPEAVEGLQAALMHPSRQPALTAYCYERMGFVAFYEQRDLRSALHFLNKAIDTYPAGEARLWLVQVHTLRSRVLRESADYEGARQAAETAITVATAAGMEARPGLADALLSAGETLTHIPGRERDALTYLQQFLQITRRPVGIDVTWSRVHEMIGDAYYKDGHYPAAANAYQAALQFNPYHPWEESIHYRMARSFYQMGEYQKAIEAIRRMIKAADTDGQTLLDYRAYQVLANAQFALRQYEAAARAYEAAMQRAAPGSEPFEKLKHYYHRSLELSRA